MTTLDLSEMRLREIWGLVMEAAARRALRESRSCRFLRSVSGTRWRSADGGLMMLVLCVFVRELKQLRFADATSYQICTYVSQT